MKQAVVLAPCKVNLTLDITRRRSDGYHEMEMILLAADLCDRVTVTLHSGRGIRVECDDQMVPLDEGNLAVRAARIFYQRTGLPAQGTDIAIEKRIPMEAGLAGGSADAAAVLVALNALCGTGLPLEELEAMALPLGADVPFCLRGGVVIARGIGEEFRILPAPRLSAGQMSWASPATPTPSGWKWLSGPASSPKSPSTCTMSWNPPQVCPSSRN